MKLLPHTKAIFDAVFDDIARARRRIWLETYILWEDVLGRRLGEQLAIAASRGADVRLLIDASGSYKTTRRWLRSLQRQGVVVRLYRRACCLTHLRIGLRDHSRIALVDDAAYTGGFNWARPWLARQDGGEGWHDCGARVQGPVVEEFAALFRERWREKPWRRSPAYQGTRYPHVQLVSEGPGSGYPCLRAHLHAFAAARARIWIENAYFFAPAVILDALAAAAARGVDVRVIIPGPTDLMILRRAAVARCTRWIRSGLRIYEYQPVVLHSKFVLVDDDWSSIGTWDIHPKSIGLTAETMLLCQKPAFVRALAELFQADQRHSTPVRLSALAQRPWTTRLLDGLAASLMAASDVVVERQL